MSIYYHDPAWHWLVLTAAQYPEIRASLNMRYDRDRSNMNLDDWAHEVHWANRHERLSQVLRPHIEVTLEAMRAATIPDFGREHWHWQNVDDDADDPMLVMLKPIDNLSDGWYMDRQGNLYNAEVSTNPLMASHALERQYLKLKQLETSFHGAAFVTKRLQAQLNVAAWQRLRLRVEWAMHFQHGGRSIEEIALDTEHKWGTEEKRKYHPLHVRLSVCGLLDELDIEPRVPLRPGKAGRPPATAT